MKTAFIFLLLTLTLLTQAIAETAANRVESAANVLNGNQTTNSPFALGKNAYVASNGLSIANVTFTNTGLYGGFFGNPVTDDSIMAFALEGK